MQENNVSLDSDKKVLEIGSGSGRLLKQMRDEGVDAVGVDARSRGVERQSLVGARIEQLPFADASFDVVLAKAVFDADVYIQDQAAMVDEIARILKTGGVFYAGGADFTKPDIVEKAGLQLISDPADINWEGLYRKVS